MEVWMTEKGQAAIVVVLLLAVIVLALLVVFTAADAAVLRLWDSLREGGILQAALMGH
jgi:hypothetical protein